MIAGHFGFAAAVKARAPAVPLWALMLASQWLDVVFVPLLLLHVEGLESIAGARPGAYAAAIIHAGYTHSLVGAVLLSLFFGGAASLRYGGGGGLVLGLVSFSHWVLDLLTHRPDMPLWPGGSAPLLGLGLWRWPTATALVELMLVAGGGALYWAAARRVAGSDPAQRRRANLCGAVVVASGLVTLGLNVAGL